MTILTMTEVWFYIRHQISYLWNFIDFDERDIITYMISYFILTEISGDGGDIDKTHDCCSINLWLVHGNYS